jgi:phosphoribosylglycinamide formyltransferase-1
MRICSPESPLKLAVLISGNGSNLQAIIDAIADGLPAEICVVISNKEDAYGLERAKREEVPTEILLDTAAKNKKQYDQLLSQAIDRHHPELIILAGFMHILDADFVAHFKNRILNIHPSLLPKYRGLNTHAQVLAAGDAEHGATVHVVTPELDEGPILMQAKISISPGDDANILKNKIHMLEHKLYPETIRLCASGRVEFQDNAVLLDGDPLSPEGLEFRMHY